MNLPSVLRRYLDSILPWLLGLISLAPFVAFHRDFADLFWFGDDWDLLDQMARHGFWSWTLRVFAENFVPVFKLAWGGVVFAGNGSYQAAIAALWLTHAAGVVLFATLLRQAGCSSFVVILSAGVFGLTRISLETLGWATQWSSVLAAIFFLGAVLWFMRTDALAVPWSWRVHGVLVAWIAASAFSFSRGVLTGAALASLCLAAGPGRQVRWSRCLAMAALCIAPAVVAAAVIMVFSPGNHRQLETAGQALEMIQYGAWYFALNPLHRLFGVDSWGWRTTLVLGGIKVAFISWGLRRSTGRLRELLSVLLLVELGNAALLGLGRYHTGLPTAISSRYQYAALLGTLPFGALWLEGMLRRWAGAAFVRVPAAILILLAAGWFATRDWPHEVDQWAEHRGRYTRHLLFQDPAPPGEGAIPGIPFMSTQRAKELLVRYQLH